jgi:FKBP-type peptidyl-prolyl cis-trans isomerase
MKQGILIAVFVVIGAAVIAAGAWYVNTNINPQSFASAGAASAAASAGTAGASASSPTATSAAASSTNTSSSPMDGLKIVDTTVGTGTVAQNGDTVSVTYVGSLDGGKVFDSSAAHGGQPFSFTLGAGQVIKGWDLGVLGMRVGGTRELTIPAALGYGAQGVPNPQGGYVIPPNATLHFTVTLLSVKNPA